MLKRKRSLTSWLALWLSAGRLNSGAARLDCAALELLLALSARLAWGLSWCIKKSNQDTTQKRKRGVRGCTHTTPPRVLERGRARWIASWFVEATFDSFSMAVWLSGCPVVNWKTRTPLSRAAARARAGTRAGTRAGAQDGAQAGARLCCAEMRCASLCWTGLAWGMSRIMTNKMATNKPDTDPLSQLAGALMVNQLIWSLTMN